MVPSGIRKECTSDPVSNKAVSGNEEKALQMGSRQPKRDKKVHHSTYIFSLSASVRSMDGYNMSMTGLFHSDLSTNSNSKEIKAFTQHLNQN